MQIATLQYDSEKERAHISINGLVDGKPITLSVGFGVATTGDLLESQVRQIVRSKAKEVLQQASALI